MRQKKHYVPENKHSALHGSFLARERGTPAGPRETRWCENVGAAAPDLFSGAAERIAAIRRVEGMRA
jgi:hypothetical protein